MLIPITPRDVAGDVTLQLHSPIQEPSIAYIVHLLDINAANKYNISVVYK